LTVSLENAWTYRPVQRAERRGGGPRPRRHSWALLRAGPNGAQQRSPRSVAPQADVGEHSGGRAPCGYHLGVAEYQKTYLGLRSLALEAASRLPAPPPGHPPASGVVIDIPAEGGFATLVAMTDSSTSPYTSVRGGRIGLGSHAAVVGATQQLLHTANAQLGSFGAEDDDDFPPGRVGADPRARPGRKTHGGPPGGELLGTNSSRPYVRDLSAPGCHDGSGLVV
jgi:hypothetical protein